MWMYITHPPNSNSIYEHKDRDDVYKIRFTVFINWIKSSAWINILGFMSRILAMFQWKVFADGDGRCYSYKVLTKDDTKWITKNHFPYKV